MMSLTAAQIDHRAHQWNIGPINAPTFPSEVYREIALARWEDDGGRVVDDTVPGSQGNRSVVQYSPTSGTASRDRWSVS